MLAASPTARENKFSSILVAARAAAALGPPFTPPAGAASPECCSRRLLSISYALSALPRSMSPGAVVLVRPFHRVYYLQQVWLLSSIRASGIQSGRAALMREQTNGSYMRLLTEWQVRRELARIIHEGRE